LVLGFFRRFFAFLLDGNVEIVGIILVAIESRRISTLRGVEYLYEFIATSIRIARISSEFDQFTID